MNVDREQVIELHHLGHSIEEICEELGYDEEEAAEVRRIINSLERE